MKTAFIANEQVVVNVKFGETFDPGEYTDSELIEVYALDAKHNAPWCAEIEPVEGGYRAFESSEDARVWRNQR